MLPAHSLKIVISEKKRVTIYSIRPCCVVGEWHRVAWCVKRTTTFFYLRVQRTIMVSLRHLFWVQYVLFVSSGVEGNILGDEVPRAIGGIINII